jgi:nucleoid DNA-binding protein
MNKAELIRELHERMNKQVSMKDLDQIVETMFTIMSEKLKSVEEVQLADFGTFSFKSSSVKSIAEFLPKQRKKSTK